MAKKYIDAEKLIAEIERQNVDKKVIKPLIHIIDSLQQEFVEVKVKPLMGYHKYCGFVATEIELQGCGVICENGEGKIYIKE